MISKAISSLLVVLFISGNIHGKQEKAAPPISEPPKLEPVFSDNFSTDTRSDYQVTGEVAWEPGKLILKPGGAIEREINGGAWARIELDLDWSELIADEPDSEMQIWFLLEGATDCFVRLRRDFKDGKPAFVIAMLDYGERNGQQFEQIVREESHASTPPQQVNVEYRHGLVTVSDRSRALLSAYIENDAAKCATFRLQSTVQTTRLERFAVAAEKQKAESFTAAEKRELEDAVRAETRMFQLYQAGKVPEAAKVGEQVFEIHDRILGEKHPLYANSLSNLAFLYNSMDQNARAEPLDIQSRDIQKEVLGEEHPKYASILQNLGAFYKELGDY